MVTLISLADQKRLRTELSKKLESPVRVELERHPRDKNCTPCEQSERLLQEITAQSSTITLHTRLTTSELAPTIRLVGKAQGQVRFLGVPAGYELPSLIDAIVDVSRGQTELSERARSQLRALSHRVHVRVFTTPT